MATVSPKRNRKAIAKRPKARIDEVSQVINESTWLIISYRRFSSDRQKHGRSEDRQNEAFDTFVAQEKRDHSNRNYILHSLPMDKGMSALYGEHRKRGHLGRFVSGIASGQIKVVPGRTILFIEEVRRLSREGAKDALQHTIFKLFDAGITLQFASGLKFSNEINKKTPGWLGVLTTLLDLAYEESRQKRDFLNDVWENRRKDARKDGKIIVASPPYWLKIVGRTYEGDKIIEFGKVEVIPAAKKALVKMFKLAAKGLGYDRIQQKLVEDAETSGGWVPPKRANQSNQEWRRTYVQLTLKNRQVIGEYQPHRKIGGKYGKRVPDGAPIPNYYPNVLEGHPGLFELVQKKIKEKAGISQAGANKNVPNILSGLAKCGYCGGAMHTGNKGRRIKYLYCYDSGGRKPPRCPMMRYDTSEQALVLRLQGIDPEMILPTKSKQLKLCRKLRRQEQQLAANVDAIQSEMDNYVQRIGKTKDNHLQEIYEANVISLRTQKQQAEKQLTKARNELENAERDSRSVRDWATEIERLQRALANGDKDVRPRLNDHLREFVDRIEVFGRGYPSDFQEDDFGDYLYETESQVYPDGRNLNRKERALQREFISWVCDRRKTNHGKFLRVYFKLSPERLATTHRPYIDVVPEDSIAGYPSIDPLWEKFIRARRKRGVH